MSDSILICSEISDQHTFSHHLWRSKTIGQHFRSNEDHIEAVSEPQGGCTEQDPEYGSLRSQIIVCTNLLCSFKEK